MIVLTKNKLKIVFAAALCNHFFEAKNCLCQKMHSKSISFTTSLEDGGGGRSGCLLGLQANKVAIKESCFLFLNWL